MRIAYQIMERYNGHGVNEMAGSVTVIREV